MQNRITVTIMACILLAITGLIFLGGGLGGSQDSAEQVAASDITSSSGATPSASDTASTNDTATNSAISTRDIAVSEGAFTYEDAIAFILTQHYPDEQLVGDQRSVNLRVVQDLNQGLAGFGGQITDIDKYMDAWTGDHLSKMIQVSRTRAQEKYREIFSQKELLEIATFYKSPTGKAALDVVQKLRRKGVVLQHPHNVKLWRENLNDADRANLDRFYTTAGGQALQNAHPQLDQFISELRLDLNAMKTEWDAGANDRFVTLLAREDIVNFDDPSMRKLVIDVLGNARR